MNKIPVSIQVGTINMIILIKHKASGSCAEWVPVKYPSHSWKLMQYFIIASRRITSMMFPYTAPILTQCCSWSFLPPPNGSGCSVGFCVTPGSHRDFQCSELSFCMDGPVVLHYFLQLYPQSCSAKGIKA